MKTSSRSSLGTDAIKLSASKIITLAISMISAMLLSRFQSLKEYGTYSQLLLVINLLTTLFMIGLPNSINYFLARAETTEEKNKFLSVYYSLSTLLSVITGLVLVLSVPLLIVYFDNTLIKSFLYFLAVYPWAKIIISSIDNVLIVHKRAFMLMIFKVSNSISLLLIIFIVHLCNLSFKTYMLMFVAVESLFALTVYYIVNGLSGKIKLYFDKELIKNIIKFSIPIGLASVIGTFNYNLDQLMIGWFYDTEKLAVYTNAGRELPVTLIASSLTAVLMPQLVRLLKKKEYKRAVDLWGYSIILSYIVICFLATGFIIYAPDVMNLLYSEKYISGVPVFIVYNFLLLLRFTYFGMILNATGKTKLIFYSSVASLGANVVLNYLLYLAFGYIGPAIATFIASFLIHVYQLIATSKTINIKLRHIFPWKQLLQITLINIFMGGTFLYLKKLIPLDNYIGSISESIVLAVIWGCLYFLILFKKIKISWFNLNHSES